MNGGEEGQAHRASRICNQRQEGRPRLRRRVALHLSSGSGFALAIWEDRRSKNQRNARQKDHTQSSFRSRANKCPYRVSNVSVNELVCNTQLFKTPPSMDTVDHRAIKTSQRVQ